MWTVCQNNVQLPFFLMFKNNYNMKIAKFLHRFKKQQNNKATPQVEAFPPSYRVTVRHNIALTPESELPEILACLNSYGISIKGKTVEEIEREIDKQVKSCIDDELSKYPENTKGNFALQDFLNNSHNRNMVILKNHIVTLKNWLEN
jgi:hypothetical protein